jgi:SOS-response transcriptional repressor LexA
MLYGTSETVFAFIQAYQQSHQQSPSFPEIAEGCQISLRTARKYVERLEKWGYLSHDKGKVRAIRILKQADAIR